MTGAELIAQERNRQIEKGFTPGHDDAHTDGSLASAATCYAIAAIHPEHYGDGHVSRAWPWLKAEWKYEADPVAMLAKAGALIAAEIDRQQRKQQTTPSLETEC